MLPSSRVWTCSHGSYACQFFPDAAIVPKRSRRATREGCGCRVHPETAHDQGTTLRLDSYLVLLLVPQQSNTELHYAALVLAFHA